MEKNNLNELKDEELLDLKKSLNKSKLFHAISIGFLGGMVIFVVVSWSLSAEKNFVFLIPILIPVAFIYRILKSPNRNKHLEDVLKQRNL